ncbi:MAG: hypothetical protein GX079_02485 [Tissierellia bacterium]|nr:hypothetical protein [Tissierellia bacterium]
MEKILELLRRVFSLFILLSLLGGSLVFLLFVIALILGGDRGGFLAVFAAKTFMPYFIRLAALAMVVGLIVIYVSGKHLLSLSDE